MDGGRFDRLTQALAARAGTRRGLIGAVAAFAAVLAGAGRGGAGAPVAAAAIACQPTNRVKLRCEDITKYSSVCGVINPVTGEHAKSWGKTHAKLAPPFVEEAWSAQGQLNSEAGCECVGGGTGYCTRATVTGFWTWEIAPRSAHLAFDLVGDYCCEDACQGAWDAYSRVIERHEASHYHDFTTQFEEVNLRFGRGLEIDGCGATPEASRQAYEERRNRWLDDLRVDILDSPHTKDPAPPNCRAKCAPKEPCKECKKGKCVPKECGKGKACCEETGKCGPAKKPCQSCPKGQARCGSRCCPEGQGCCATTGRCGPKKDPCREDVACVAGRRGVATEFSDPESWCGVAWWEGTVTATKSLHVTANDRTHDLEARMSATFRVPTRTDDYQVACSRVTVGYPQTRTAPGASGRQEMEWHERDDWRAWVTTRDGVEVEAGKDWFALPHGTFYVDPHAGTYDVFYSPGQVRVTAVTTDSQGGSSTSTELGYFPSFQDAALRGLPLPQAGFTVTGAVEQTGRWDGATERLSWSVTGVCA